MTRKRWKNPDKRMAQALELRERGWSLRRIGTELAVSEGTIRNDLARCARQQQEEQDAPRPMLRLVEPPTAQSGRNPGAQSDSDYASEMRTDCAVGEGA